MNSALSIHTNRELYLFVMQLTERHAESARSLEDYLKALFALARCEREHATFALSKLTVWLERAFVDAPPTFDARWLEAHARIEAADAPGGYAGWENRIHSQIVDLHEMLASGALDNEMRSFGIDSPRGARWYNFTPLAFLECGIDGAFGGWRESDESGREYVPGPVATNDDSGAIVTVDPREFDDPEVILDPMGWDAFTSFLEAGQWYE